MFSSIYGSAAGAGSAAVADPYGFQAMNQQQQNTPPPPPQDDFLEDTSWTGEDYSKFLQGLGHLVDAGGGAFQKIYLATQADEVKANIQQNSSSEIINKLITENQTLKANINQTGAVPQVYAPQVQQQQPQQQSNLKTSHIVGAVLGIGVLITGVMVLKR